MPPEFIHPNHPEPRTTQKNAVVRPAAEVKPPFRFLEREIQDVLDNKYLSAHKAISSLKTQKELEQAVENLNKLISEYAGDVNEAAFDFDETKEVEHLGAPTKATVEKLSNMESAQRNIKKGIGNLRQLLEFANSRLEDMRHNNETKKPAKR